MINRVIYSNKVYYKVKDLVEVYDNKFSLYKIKKVIKEQGVNTTKLKGYGNCLFIEETNIAMIEIDGAITVMKTKFKDRKQELKSEMNIVSLKNFMLRDMLPNKSDKELMREILENVDKKMNSPIKLNENSCRIGMYGEILDPKKLNEKLNEYGIEEHFIGIEFLYEERNEIKTKIIGGLVNNSDEILCDDFVLDRNNDEYIVEDLRLCKIQVDEMDSSASNKCYEELHSGETKKRTKEEIMQLIFENIITRDDYENEDDWLVMRLDNGRYISVDKNLLLCILRNKFKIIEVYGYSEEVVNDKETDIIDVEYKEVEEQEDIDLNIPLDLSNICVDEDVS